MDVVGLVAARVEEEGQEADGDVHGFAGDFVAMDLKGQVSIGIAGFCICIEVGQGRRGTYEGTPFAMNWNQTQRTRTSAKLTPVFPRGICRTQMAIYFGAS